MPERIVTQNGNMIANTNTQYVKAQNQKRDKMSVKVTKGGDLRAK